MTRDLSTELKEAMTAPESGFVVLTLLTISHPDLETPLRIVNNKRNVSSRGNVFGACFFTAPWPEDKEGTSPKTTVTFNNANQWFTPTLRTLVGEYTVLLEQVSPTDLDASPQEFDTVELAYLPLIMTDITYDVRRVTGTLVANKSMARRFPFGTFSATDFPGVR